MMDAMTVSTHDAQPANHGPQQRSDMHASAIVDQGIAVQNTFSTLCAIEYLKSNNVRPEVIERVLLHPELRRKLVH